MKKINIFLIGLLFVFKISYSQTTTIIGVMSVYTAEGGLGCDASCDEALHYSTFAPYQFCNTGAATTGASSTENPMWTSFNIPSACAVTVRALYGGPDYEYGICPDSRADANDRVGIATGAVTNGMVTGGTTTLAGTCSMVVSGGGATLVSDAKGCGASGGGGNSVVEANYSTSGPVTISVFGLANRADEVITYTVIGTGSSCSNIGVVVLPIELLGFAAYRMPNNMIDIKWATLTETNNDYFTIEYSLDAINFIPYIKINGAGNSYERKDYDCYFKEDVGNANPYFRLKQVDYNGKYSYSSIISLGTSNGFIIPTSSLIAYYHTEKEKIIAKFHLDYPQEVNLKLYTVSGQEVYSQYNLLNEGDNEILINPPIVNGTYFLVYQNGTSPPVHKKIMVSN